MKQKEVMIDNFSKGMKLMQEKTTKQLENIFIEPSHPVVKDSAKPQET